MEPLKELISLQDLSPQLQVLVQLELRQKQLEQTLLKPVQLQMNFQEDTPAPAHTIIPDTFVSSSDWRRDTNSIICAIERKTKNYSMLRGKIYREVESRGKCKLNIRLENLKKNMLMKGMPMSKVKEMNYLDVIEQDERLIHVYVSVVREVARTNQIVYDKMYASRRV